MRPLRVEAASEGVTMQGHPEVKAQSGGGGGANCSQGSPEVRSGRPNSIIKHRASESVEGDKGWEARWSL